MTALTASGCMNQKSKTGSLWSPFHLRRLPFRCKMMSHSGEHRTSSPRRIWPQCALTPAEGRRRRISYITNGVTKYLAFTLHPHPCPLPFKGEGISSPSPLRGEGWGEERYNLFSALVNITESMKYWTVLDVTPSATMGLYQRRAEILRSAQNDKHFLLSLVARPRTVVPVRSRAFGAPWSPRPAGRRAETPSVLREVQQALRGQGEYQFRYASLWPCFSPGVPRVSRRLI